METNKDSNIWEEFNSIIAQADNQTKNVHYEEAIENQNIIQGQGTLSRSYLQNLGINNTWLFTPGLPPSKYKYKETRYVPESEIDAYKTTYEEQG